MKVIGITGGISSGKTTICNFLEKKNFPIHDSDLVVKDIYKKAPQKLLVTLKKIGLSHSVKNKKINKNIIRNELFNNKSKKKILENYFHNEVRKSREKFLKKHKAKKTKIVILDIPLLFEAKLLYVCDYIILLYAPQKVKIKRAIKRKHYENILIIPTVIDHYIFKNELRRTDKMNQDLAIVDNLINNLDEKLKKKLIFKPHPIEIRKKKEFSYYNYFKNNHPHIQLYNHKEKLDELINKSQLSIFLYLATPFLENLALNKPSIMIYHSGFEETLNDEAKIYFKYLSDSKIVFTSVVEAIKFLNENGNDRIEQWWNSKDTQFARNKFSKYYVNKDKNSLKTLINCLKNS